MWCFRIHPWVRTLIYSCISNNDEEHLSRVCCALHFFQHGQLQVNRGSLGPGKQEMTADVCIAGLTGVEFLSRPASPVQILCISSGDGNMQPYSKATLGK